MTYIVDISPENVLRVQDHISKLESLVISITNDKDYLQSDILPVILDDVKELLEYWQGYLDRVHEILENIKDDN